MSCILLILMLNIGLYNTFLSHKISGTYSVNIHAQKLLSMWLQFEIESLSHITLYILLFFSFLDISIQCVSCSSQASLSVSFFPELHLLHASHLLSSFCVTSFLTCFIMILVFPMVVVLLVSYLEPPLISFIHLYNESILYCFGIY